MRTHAVDALRQKSTRHAGAEAWRSGLHDLSAGLRECGRDRRAWVSDRGLQRARRWRRVHGRIPERLVTRRAAGRMRAPRQCVRRARRVAPWMRAGDSDGSSSSTTFMQHGASTPRLREDATLNRLHRATTRRPAPPWIAALAFDHRAPLEQLAAELNTPLARITQFKHLVARAAQRASLRARRARRACGLILDDRYGADLLARARRGGLVDCAPRRRARLAPAALRARPQRAGNVARVAVTPYRQVSGVV